MSINELLKSAAVITIGTCVGYASVFYFNQPSENNRQLASLTFSKLGSQQFAQNLFEIKISHQQLAATSDDVTTLKVSIEAFKAFPAGLKYSWDLPDQVTLVEGVADGFLDDFAALQKKEYIVKVKGYSKQVRNYISFTVTGEIDQKQIQKDALISSRPEDSFEYVVQQRENQHTQESVSINKLMKTKAKAPIDLDKVSF